MIRLLVAAAVLSVALAAEGQTVDMDIQPASATMNVGQTITLAVRAVAGVNEVDNVQANLNFDKTVFQVVSITPRPAFLGGGASTMDNPNGHADFSYSTSAAFVVGTNFVADVAFQAIGTSPGSVISFNTAFPRISQASRTGVGYTGTFTSATIVVENATPTPTTGAGTPTPVPTTAGPTRTPPTPCGPSDPCVAPLVCVPTAEVVP